MLEPKPQQKYVAELNDLLVQSHVLASQITAAAPLLQAINDADPKPFEPVQRAFGIVRDNLSDAQAAISDDDGAPPSDAIKDLRRDLDTMVAAAERAQTLPADAIQDLKLLAHQCKQMLTASTLIRKDATQIHLPS